MKLYERFLPYAIAIGTTAIALVLTFWLQPFLVRSVGAFFYIAIIITAWYANRRSALVAIFLSTISITYFLFPHLSIVRIVSSKELFTLCTFVIVSLISSALISNFQELKNELEQRIAKRTRELTEVNANLKEALIDLKRSEESRRLAIDLTNIGFWDWKMSDTKVIWNDNHFTLLGLAPYSVEPTYDIWRNSVHPDDLAWLEPEFFKSAENHTDFYCEYRVIHTNGSIRWFMQRSTTIYDDSGKPSRSLGVLLDVTDRKQIEEVLKQSEEKYRFLCECLPIGIFMMDSDGHFTYTNPRYQVISDCIFDQALGEGWINFIHPDDQEKIKTKWSKAISEKQEFADEIRYIHQDRSIRFGRVQSAIFSSPNELIGYVGTVEDVTDSRAVETMKKEFISIVSHELRTPLSSMRGSLGLLAAGVFKNNPESAQQMLDIAFHETERLVRLVNDILDLERLTAEKVELNQEWCDGLAMMQESVETVQSLALQNNITLLIEQTGVQVWADRDRVIQTLVNLLSNAIKFSPPNTMVRLNLKDQADHVLFQVTDQGRGIPADKLEVIFARFQQVDASDSRQKGGTGLGLAICKGIIQQHCGKIWVESVVGQGSSFYFTLPKFLD